MVAVHEFRFQAIGSFDPHHHGLKRDQLAQSLAQVGVLADGLGDDVTGAFQGILDVESDDENFRATVRGAGRDTRSPSSARAMTRG